MCAGPRRCPFSRRRLGGERFGADHRTQPRPLCDGHMIHTAGARTMLAARNLVPVGVNHGRNTCKGIVGVVVRCRRRFVLRAAPDPVAARRRAVTVLVSHLHVDEPAPAALVGVKFFFSLCGRTFVRPVALLWRHVFFIVIYLVAAARYARAHVCNTAVLAQESRGGALRAGAAQRREQSSLDRLPENPKASEPRCNACYLPH
ncbi:unnamed protein product [Pelagomonas calceolata]|uniref:Uncharacterized protein n=1 Tax=Pelagomonas calceolata TaxID=35677 RepID=A0A8J2T1V2_9STRA|nr:unnamed protein product [Pelagomonas calceolata]